MTKAKKATPAPAVQEAPARKPRTTDPDQRLAMCDAAIERFEKLAASRKELLAQAEALAASRRKSVETTEGKLEKLRAKRERIVSLKERREGKVVGKRAANKAEKEKMSALQKLMAEKGLSLDDLQAMLDQK